MWQWQSMQMPMGGANNTLNNTTNSQMPLNQPGGDGMFQAADAELQTKNRPIYAPNATVPQTQPMPGFPYQGLNYD